MDEEAGDDLAVGDDLDCPVCGDVHEIRRSKGVRIKGFRQRVHGSLYVECPEVGDLAVTGDGDIEVVGEGGGEAEEDSDELRDDWP